MGWGGRSHGEWEEGHVIGRYPHRDADAADRLAADLHRAILRSNRARAPLLYLCIGTDRSTGDALGPLVGDRLRERLGVRAPVFGTLAQPVHAANLRETVADIERLFPSRFVIAIDACLGRPENVGTITLGEGPLYPGAGVNKALPPIGDLFLTATVNVGGYMEYAILQNTRLHIVFQMATVIATALSLAASPPRPSSRAATAVPPLPTSRSIGSRLLRRRVAIVSPHRLPPNRGIDGGTSDAPLPLLE